jgi:hypothetical protein
LECSMMILLFLQLTLKTDRILFLDPDIKQTNFSYQKFSAEIKFFMLLLQNN